MCCFVIFDVSLMGLNGGVEEDVGERAADSALDSFGESGRKAGTLLRVAGELLRELPSLGDGV